ncbi:hypothetical protein [uncultured Sphingomonas sp.]|uniref:hypothetical protein n=1 Tax=uncultured Sphingomonas sp. TaxID=158754 RepID=UPI0035CC39ED
MSHIPASKMPHAKAHDEHDENARPSEPGTSGANASDAPSDAKPLTDGPEIKPAAAPVPKKSGDHATSAVPYVAIATVGALAIGGIVAALALRRPEPPHKGGKAKSKGRGRKNRDAG